MEAESTPKTFAELGLSEPLVAALAALGYEAPTPIQDRTIPILLAGNDLIGQAQTGTGKTAAFALPILSKIDPSIPDTQALVLTPTRELAMQVAEAIHTYAQKMAHVSVLPVYGGAPIFPQLKRLERGVHVVVGTPGRLIDHLDRGSLRLANIRMIVLDEADEMLKMGFIEDIERILGEATSKHQTALFSATMPDEVQRIAKRYLDKPQRVSIEHKTMTAPLIEQRFLNISEGQKLDVLTQLLEIEEAEAVLIFRRTKNGAAELAEKLEGRGFAAVAMHGDMNQVARENVIRRLKAGTVEIVVATDVAARGLDVEQIEHVINYDVPNDVEAYVHRIGRTGRAGRTGTATLFITPRERRMMREIERYTNMQIKPMKIPTHADVAAHRIGQFKDSIRKTLSEGDLDLYVQLVEQLVDEGQNDIAEIAAAAAKIANGSRSLAPVPEPRYEPPAFSEGPRPRAFEGPRNFEGPRGGGDDAPRRDEKKVRLQMDVGKRDGIRPADVVGSIANEAGVPGRDIGPIDIREDITFVVVPARVRDVVIAKVGHARFRGRNLNLRVADDRAPEQPRPHLERPRRATRDERPERPSRPPQRFNEDRPARPTRFGAASRDRDRERSGTAAPARKPFGKPFAGKSSFGKSKTDGKPGGGAGGKKFRGK
jgi:ATP-dependent RNA helicase DeaD